MRRALSTYLLENILCRVQCEDQTLHTFISNIAVNSEAYLGR